MFKKPADPTLSSESLKNLVLFSREFSSKHNKHNELLERLNSLKEELRFPAVDEEVGEFLSLISRLKVPKLIFEFGSGYGHSAFWYFQNLEGERFPKVILTEKRNDLESHFHELPWPEIWRNHIEYYQGDAFKILEKVKEPIDLCFIDGQKSLYLDFLKEIEVKLAKDGLVLIDNSFWMGKILNPEDNSQSTIGVKKLYSYLEGEGRKNWRSSLIPLSDGILVLQRK